MTNSRFEFPTLKDVFENHEKILEAYCLVEKIFCDELESVEAKQKALQTFSEALVRASAATAVDEVLNHFDAVEAITKESNIEGQNDDF